MKHAVHITAFMMGLLMNGCDNGHPKSVLNYVANNKNRQLQEWIESGGDLGIKTRNGESLMYIATGPHGGIEVVSVLLEAGADPNIGHGKYTPLMNAASWCDARMVSLLLHYGANPTLENSDGRTALECVGMGEGEAAVSELLADAVTEWEKETQLRRAEVK